MAEKTRPTYSHFEREKFYRSAAQRFKAELLLTGARAAIHLENKNDEVFWAQVLAEACPGQKFRFIAASRSIAGFMSTGCSQCLHYLNFLDNRFWIAIDSDYRYLNEEERLDAVHHVLQTYTYSFENHFCYHRNCQRALDEARRDNPYAQLATTSTDTPSTLGRSHIFWSVDFSFETFLRNYSFVIYPLLMWQMYMQTVAPESFSQSKLNQLLTLSIGPKSVYGDGRTIINTLRQKVNATIKQLLAQYPEADTTWFEARCNALGVTRDNCYLYVRGHQLYDLICAIGSILAPHFEEHLTTGLCYGQYKAIRQVIDDIEAVTSRPNRELFR